MDDKLINKFRDEFEEIRSDCVMNGYISMHSDRETIWAAFLIARLSMPVVELPSREWFVDGLEHKTIIKKDVISALESAGIPYTIKGE